MKMLQCPNPCQLHHYFVDFVNMKCMSWFTFLHLEKMELCFVLFCFVLLVTEVKVFYLIDPIQNGIMFFFVLFCFVLF